VIRVDGAGSAGLGAQRVLIYAVTGSGKTTLARRLGEATGLPWHSADDEIGWLPGWVQMPVDEQHRLAAAICAQDRWILDTAYASWRPVVLERAELIVALDYPRWISLSRLLRRTVGRIVDRRDICNGNHETLRQALSHDSIIAWHFTSFASKRRQIAAWIADPEAPTVLRFTRPRQVERWLRTL
jgi:adenylate kinase family enzyme